MASRRSAKIALLSALLAGCGGALPVDRAYVDAVAAREPVRHPGRILLVTTPDADEQVHLRAGVETPVGAYVRELGLALAARSFAGGVRHASRVPDALPDAPILEPRAAWFDWSGGEGGARRTARVVLRVGIRLSDGSVTERQYDSGFVDAGAGRPASPSSSAWAMKPFAVAWEMCLRDLETFLPRR